ncbi:MAG: lytic transglycosylase domain-containing protein [Alphaproteobacteria bacterium]|nr:lytic transglycosylase domain-containing protein [Alphaproteobacteria bacterium]
MPQAAQLASLAQRRGADPLPVISRQRMISFGAAPRRFRPGTVSGDLEADRLRPIIQQFVEANDPEGAETQYREAVALLGNGGRAEIAQRVAWLYYTEGRDQDALRVAREGRSYQAPEWSAQAAWVEGLAAWRLNDCNSASGAFRYAALGTRDSELAAAGHYWSARAEQACGRPHEVAARMRAASVDPESFYGQVARETLGMVRTPPVQVEAPSDRTLRRVEALPNVRRAIVMAGLGRRALADELLRHQAAIGEPTDQPALVEIARRLSLGSAQYYLGTNGPRGAKVNISARYPAPAWQPNNGWRIDPLMAYAHIIQESDFRTQAVSPANAVGLMQVRPATAGDIARRRGDSPPSVEMLKIPEYNLDYGQAYIAEVRGDRYLQDQLPRIIAAYNAGPVPVRRWNGINDKGDPLLWIESLSYWETRFYVPAVLRNYFVYHAQAGSTPAALKDLVEHRWPTYPDL